MKQLLDKVLNHPVVAHAMAANDRYNRRLGPQFAAAITYFTVLSLVPILLFAFSMLGLTLTVIRPDLLDQVQSAIDSQLAGNQDLSKSIGGVIRTR